LTPFGDGGGRTLLDVVLPEEFLSVLWSVFGGLPPPFFLGASDAPRWAILRYRLTEERLTPKRRAAADLDVVPPPSTARTILSKEGPFFGVLR